MRTVMQVSGKMVSLFTRLWVWLTTQLWNLVSNLRVRFFRKYQSAVNLFNQLVPLVQKCKALLVNLITQVLSIKLVVTAALTKIWDLGLQLATTVRQTLQLVITAFKKNKGLVAKIKSVPSRIKESKIVQTLMAHKWTQAGLKLLGTVRQHQQRAQRQNSKGL